MAFREHEGFRVTKDEGTKRPKGVSRKRKPKADRFPVYATGDDVSTERAMWLNPSFRYETADDVRRHLTR